MAEVRLPATLQGVLPGAPRRVDVDAGSVADAIARLDERYPGLHDRLCEPGPVLRRHIRVYVDGEPAGLESPLSAGSRLDVVAAISGG